MVTKKAKIRAIKKSIAHWRRMVKWASTQPIDKEPSRSEMFGDIKECWYGENCALCKTYADNENEDCSCENCPLNSDSSISCCAQWIKVVESNTWGNWLLAADKMLEKLIRCLKVAERRK